MARGWESKQVESQIEAAETRAALSKQKQVDAQEIQLQRERESLELSRIRVVRDMAAALNPRYRDQLQQSLDHLDAKLKALSQKP